MEDPRRGGHAFVVHAQGVMHAQGTRPARDIADPAFSFLNSTQISSTCFHCGKFTKKHAHTTNEEWGGDAFATLEMFVYETRGRQQHSMLLLPLLFLCLTNLCYAQVPPMFAQQPMYTQQTVQVMSPQPRYAQQTVMVAAPQRAVPFPYERLGGVGQQLSAEECAAFGVPNGSSWTSAPAAQAGGYANYYASAGFWSAPVGSYEPEASY